MSSCSAADPLAASLSHLQLDAHPAVAAALRDAHSLASLRRYRQAEQQLRAFLTTTQQQLQAAKQQTAAAGAADGAAPAAVDSSSLPTLSQLLTGVLPQLRVLATLQREAESGEYDLRVMQVETEQYRRQAAAAAAAASAPPPSRPLHAEFVHPHVQVAAIAGRSRGLIATSQAASAGAAAACAVAASAGPPPVCLPAQTTVLCCKAVGLVTDSASPAATDAAAADGTSSGTPMSSAAREERMASALVTLLALKMQSQPSLIPSLYQLDAGERYEEDRSRRLAERSPLAPYRVATDASTLAMGDLSAGVVAEADLAIDLERLALIVARNAFAPPSDSALQGGAGGESGSAGASGSSSGVWITCSLLNHSCRPNAHWFCVGDVMFVRTLRDVHEGEELTISYTGFDAKLYSQRRALCAGWDFECHCAAWCEPMEAHPQLAPLEEAFVSESGALESRVHQLVSAMHSSDEGTLTHRRAMADLAVAKADLERLIGAFRRQVASACGPHCVANGAACAPEAEMATTATLSAPADDAGAEGDAETESSAAAPGAAAVASAAPAASAGKKKKKKKKAGASTATLTQPVHTQQLLLHLAMPLSLLALCHSSLHDGAATAASYTAALQRHEALSMEAIGLLERQYGSGDETVVFAWFELLNTWLQFLNAGIEYRSIEQMKAIVNLCVTQHCAQFGAKPDHFRHTWMHLLTSMGLAELLDP